MCRADGEPVTVLLEKDRKARKPHPCGECGRTIQPGERYEEQRYVMEGCIYNHATCAHCMIPRSWLASNCNAWVYGEVGDDISEHAADYPYLREPLSRLWDGMRRKWAMDDGSLMPIPDQAPALDVQDRHN